MKTLFDLRPKHNSKVFAYISGEVYVFKYQPALTKGKAAHMEVWGYIQ